MIYELGLAREEWDRRLEKLKEENTTSSRASSLPISTLASDPSSGAAQKPKSTYEPPQSENLEECRRKLSFLANLLNSPRWELPQGEVSMLKIVRNQRIPYSQQQSELETVAKVQIEVTNALRSKLSLAPLAGTTHRSPTEEFGKGFAYSPFEYQSENEERTSQDFSPSKYFLDFQSSPRSSHSHTSGSARPRVDALDSIFLEAKSEGESDVPSSSVSESEPALQGAQDSDSSSFTSLRSNDRGTSTERPVARQLFNQTEFSSPRSTTSSSFETEFGKRLAKGDEGDLGDLGRLLSADVKLQDELTDELVRYAAAMKDSALNAGIMIRSDTSKLDKMAQHMETNVQATQAATSTVNELLNATSGSIYGSITTVATVFLVFVMVWIFMKIVPKP